MDGVTLRRDTATAGEIEAHLRECSADFVPPLENRVDLPSYAEKLCAAATTGEAWQADGLVGLIAYYLNEDTAVAFISSVSTLARVRRYGLARKLLTIVLDEIDGAGYVRTELEVDNQNAAALRLYRALGFEEVGAAGCTLRLARPRAAHLQIQEGERHVEE